ncbi:uncharacterized protein LOC6505295 isoform X1 [Drosophila ananassae]|nr:uncharacterized protein LOC6505295 isoform X1 [Drosophila ananassae]
MLSDLSLELVMADYSKYLVTLTEQLGLAQGTFNGLRPSQKAVMYVGAATVACVMVGLTVKSLRGRKRKEPKKRRTIDLLDGADGLMTGRGDGSVGDSKDDSWISQDSLDLSGEVSEGDSLFSSTVY